MISACFGSFDGNELLLSAGGRVGNASRRRFQIPRLVYQRNRLEKLREKPWAPSRIPILRVFAIFLFLSPFLAPVFDKRVGVATNIRIDRSRRKVINYSWRSFVETQDCVFPHLSHSINLANFQVWLLYSCVFWTTLIDPILVGLDEGAIKLVEAYN